MPRLSHTLSGLLLFCLCFCACNRSTKNDSSNGKQSNDPFAGIKFDSGHDKMLAMLDRIKQRAPEEHQYFGRGIHKKLRKELDRLGPTSNKLNRFQVLNQLGYFELCYEESPDLAIQHLTQAYQLLPQLVFPHKQAKASAHFRSKFYLGVAYLRLGEMQNCCQQHTSESCILPIRGTGVHSKEEGSRQAIKYFSEVLKGTDMTDEEQLIQCHAPARWLLNIAYMTLDEYPDKVPEKYRISPESFEPEIDFPRFENVAPKLNLNTMNQAGSVIVDDFDNDDYLDIFTSTSDPTGQTHFFHNNGDGTFEDRTEAAGLLGMYGGLNMVQADYDNDGDLDVFILRGAWHGKSGQHPNSLLRNNGEGVFRDVTFEAGLGEFHHPTKTAGWADFDNDGDLDLFIGNETTPDHSAPCQLFRNNGNGTFTDVAGKLGVRDQRFVMGIVWGDYNNDRYPDLYLAAGDKPNRLFQSRPNQGNAASNWSSRLYQNKAGKSFSNVARKLGMSRPDVPFPVWFWDYNNDGALDLYVSSTSGNIGVLSFDALSEDLTSKQNGFVRLSSNWGVSERAPITSQFEIPALYRNDGRGGFTEVAQEHNLLYPTEPMGANFGDLNGDGYLDFYLATGNVGYEELRPNVMFLNQDGNRFANVTMGGGFGHLQKGHGVSFADIDNDGDQDIYVQMGGQLPGDKFNDALFENPGFKHHWITLKLVGRQSNRSAIGARIHVRILEDGKQRSIYRHVNSGGSFGCNPLRQNIGLRKAEKIESIEVYWPTSDLTQAFRNVEMDQTIQIVEAEDRYKVLTVDRFVLGGTTSSPLN